MKLHQNKQLFRQAIQFTAQTLGIPEIYVEKDYWVTLVLHTLYHSDIKNEVVFKGGTALSKCFGLIERFSEDIDLVVLREAGDSGNKLTNRIKKISTLVSTVLPEIAVENITQKMGMNRKTAHTYNKEFTGNYGQVRDVVIVEATWLGYHEPYTKAIVSSYVYEMMIKNNQEALTHEYELLPFEVLALEPVRTVCEKIMSLVRFSYSADPMLDLKNKIRHTYDLHLLLQNEVINTFFESADFDILLNKVAQDDVDSYRNDNLWLQNHPNDSWLFKDLNTSWNTLKNSYTTDFGELVLGPLPDEAEIAKTLLRISKRMESIQWTIKIP
ncbi:nucleotidyl transferase AbiEii/AbiGii toxin family protein [Flavobacterium sp. GA093]|uniref:Nucleotidyl transferase AbiEii/AbiGii toxin family protein n=2 Tax=Flavobacterium hydrocarbonoxydans TaxID=2683249 RepID=A0A6I4NQB8_9FLAO|nr:nucleotidyl transferase AbiEii/AbiGii toxin family protein [Flavobacterium hydrocarbonoxydans]